MPLQQRQWLGAVGRSLLAGFLAWVGVSFSCLAQPQSPPKATPPPSATPTNPAPSATPSATPNSAIIEKDRAYESAYAKGDAKTLAGFFSEDAEYLTDDGQTLSGRAAIEQTIAEALRLKPGSTITITPISTKSLTPEVLVEKGTSTVTNKNGEMASSLYTAIYLKKNGDWKISQLIETTPPDVTPHEHLSELEWLVGEWKEADSTGSPTSSLTIRSQNSWARGGNFITRNVTVQNGGQTTLEGWQIIGWDPVEERIRSWTFDTEGGFSEGNWTRDGQRWLLKETGVAPNGSRTTAEITMAKLSPDRFSWEAQNRTLDGEPQPSISRIEITRVTNKQP